MAHKTVMGQVYRWRDLDVTIVSQWRDSFGRPMLRVAAKDGAKTLAAGLMETAFLAEAVFLAAQGPEIVEGARE